MLERTDIDSWQSRLANAVTNLGLWQTAAYTITRAALPITRPQTFRAWSKHARHPVICRNGTSDKDVFGQIFVDREYRCLDHIESAELIVDCGANCGHSAAYFLSRFPNAHLIAIEPDPGNFAVMLRNLEPYRGRYTAIRAGVWSHQTGLVLESVGGDGREWARSVRPAREGEVADIEAVEIGGLIGERSISILKVDIEGSESEVFRTCPEWLDRVDHMVIETHGGESEEAVRRAMDGRGFDVSRCDELLVFTHQVHPGSTT